MSLYDITIKVTPFLLLGVILIFLYKKRYNQEVLKPLFLYSFFAFLIENISRILTYYGEHNIFLINIYVIMQLIFFSNYFIKLFKNKRLTRVIKIGIYAIVAFSLIQYILDTETLVSYNPVIYLITIVPVIAYSLYAIFKATLFKKLNNYVLINFGLLIYLTSSLVVFLSSSLLIKLNLDQFNYIYILNNATYIIFLILVFINIWKLTNLKPVKS